MRNEVKILYKYYKMSEVKLIEDLISVVLELGGGKITVLEQSTKKNKFKHLIKNLIEISYPDSAEYQ